MMNTDLLARNRPFQKNHQMRMFLQTLLTISFLASETGLLLVPLMASDETATSPTDALTPHNTAPNAALEKLLQMANAHEADKSTLTDAIAIHNRATRVQNKPDPQLTYAVALIAFNARSLSQVSFYAQQAWDQSNQTMLPAARLYGRSLLDRGHSRKVLELADQLMTHAQQADLAADDREFQAALAGKLIGFFLTVDAVKLRSNQREKLEQFHRQMRQLPDRTLVEHYAAAYSSVQKTLTESTEPAAAVNSELAARLDRFSREAEIAELSKDAVKTGQEQRQLELEQTINRIDMQWPGKWAEFQRHQAHLNLLYNQQQSLQQQRTPIAQLAAAQRTIGAAEANMAILVEQIQTLMRQRDAVGREFKLLTGKAANTNAELDKQRSQLARQRKNLSDSMEKSKPSDLKKSQAAEYVLPIDLVQETRRLNSD